ncbi:MAG TPA: hypothetical protein VF254_06405 [Gammaproteobacteria bacterium]
MHRLLLPAFAALLLVIPPASFAACGSPAFDLLENLAGRWEVSRNGQVIGRLTVQREAGECALLEKWEATDGVEAVAMHWTEPAADDKPDDGEPPARVLKQVYVEDSGWVIEAEAYVENGALVYEGPATVEGEDVVLRAVLHGLGTDRIVHVGDVSLDGGDTWRRIDSMVYRRID